MKFKKGKPVDMTPEQKVELGVRKSLSIVDNGCANWMTNLAMEIPVQGTSDYGSTYKAKGTFTLNMKLLSSGDILLPKKTHFSVEVRDHKDELGLPDVVVTHFSMK